MASVFFPLPGSNNRSQGHFSALGPLGNKIEIQVLEGEVLADAEHGLFVARGRARFKAILHPAPGFHSVRALAQRAEQEYVVDFKEESVFKRLIFGWFSNKPLRPKNRPDGSPWPDHVPAKTEYIEAWVRTADLDIDSDNDNGVIGLSRSESEDSVENPPTGGQEPGKLLLFPKDSDINNNDVPDFADGINMNGQAGANRCRQFPVCVLFLQGFNEYMSGGENRLTKVRFEYSGSDPAELQREVQMDGSVLYTPASGQMRLWSQDGPKSRRVEALPSGHYLNPGQAYLFSDLKDAEVAQGHWRFFVEPIGASLSTADESIEVWVDPFGQNQWIMVDTVKVTLIPLELKNLSDPYRGTGTNPAHHNKDTPIVFYTADPAGVNSVAWIAAHDPDHGNSPRMPHLQAKIATPTGLQILLKLQVTFQDRHHHPHRDFDSGDPNDSNSTPYLMTDPIVSPGSYTADTPDQVTIPNPANPTQNEATTADGWHKVSDENPWDIYLDPDWTAATAQGFFGGDAVLSVRIKSGDESVTILPSRDFKFRIGGENPDPVLCKNYLISLYGGPTSSGALAGNPHAWFAWAIAKDETQGEGSSGYYNHFLNNGGRTASVPGHEGTPNWHNDGTQTSGANTPRLTGTGGYGLFQLTYESRNTASQSADANYLMPRNWIWNWQTNAVGFGIELQTKITFGQNLYDALMAAYSTAHGVIPSYGNFSGLDAIIVTAYNGMSGGEMTPDNRVFLNNTLIHSCWIPLPNGGWQFLQNGQNYAQHVNAIINGS